MLNIMRQPWDDSVARLLLAAPNRAMLLSEMLVPTAHGPYYPGRHFAEADLDELPDRIGYFLEHELERQELADEAFECVTREWTMERVAGKGLNFCKC